MADKTISRLQSQMRKATKTINEKIAEQEELEGRIRSIRAAIQIMQSAERCAKELRSTTNAMTFDNSWRGRAKRNLDSEHSFLKKNTKTYQQEIASTIGALRRKKLELELQRNALIRFVGSLRGQIVDWQRDVNRRKKELARSSSSGRK